MGVKLKKKKKFKMPKASNPEKEIAKYLKANKIKFEKEKTFPGLLSMMKGELRFDFYIKEKNLLLEYDGPHHSTTLFGKKTLVKTYVNDKIKNSYANRMGITLIRIGYKENLKKRLEEIFLKK